MLAIYVTHSQIFFIQQTEQTKTVFLWIVRNFLRNILNSMILIGGSPFSELCSFLSPDMWLKISLHTWSLYFLPSEFSDVLKGIISSWKHSKTHEIHRAVHVIKLSDVIQCFMSGWKYFHIHYIHMFNPMSLLILMFNSWWKSSLYPSHLHSYPHMWWRGSEYSIPKHATLA